MFLVQGNCLCSRIDHSLGTNWWFSQKTLKKLKNKGYSKLGCLFRSFAKFCSLSGSSHPYRYRGIATGLETVGTCMSWLASFETDRTTIGSSDSCKGGFFFSPFLFLFSLGHVCQHVQISRFLRIRIRRWLAPTLISESLDQGNSCRAPTFANYCIPYDDSDLLLALYITGRESPACITLDYLLRSR